MKLMLFLLVLSLGTLAAGFLLVITVLHISIVPAIGEVGFHRTRCIITDIFPGQPSETNLVNVQEGPVYEHDEHSTGETSKPDTVGLRNGLPGRKAVSSAGWHERVDSSVGMAGFCLTVTVTFTGKSQTEVKTGHIHVSDEAPSQARDKVRYRN